MAPPIQLTGQDDPKKVTTVAVDLNKWVPVLSFLGMVVLTVGGWIISYGRNSSAADALKIEVAKDESRLDDQSTQIVKQSERIKALEVEMDIYMSRIEAEKRTQSELGGGK
jgi:hypothetical protein